MSFIVFNQWLLTLMRTLTDAVYLCFNERHHHRTWSVTAVELQELLWYTVKVKCLTVKDIFQILHLLLLWNAKINWRGNIYVLVMIKASEAAPGKKCLEVKNTSAELINGRIPTSKVPVSVPGVYSEDPGSRSDEQIICPHIVCVGLIVMIVKLSVKYEGDKKKKERNDWKLVSHNQGGELHSGASCSG